MGPSESSPKRVTLAPHTRRGLFLRAKRPWMLSPRDGGGNEAPGPRLRPLPIAGPLSCVLQYHRRHHAVSKRALGTPRGCFKHPGRHTTSNVRFFVLPPPVIAKFDHATFPSHLRPLFRRHAPAYPPQKARQFA